MVRVRHYKTLHNARVRGKVESMMIVAGSLGEARSLKDMSNVCDQGSRETVILVQLSCSPEFGIFSVSSYSLSSSPPMTYLFVVLFPSCISSDCLLDTNVPPVIGTQKLNSIF